MNANSLLNCFKKFQNLKVAVFGDIMMDTYIFSNTERLSPEGPFPVYKFKDKKLSPGRAANVAINLSKMGVDVHLFCLLGNDNLSKDFIKILRKEGIKIKFKKIKNFDLINKVRLISNDVQISRLDLENEINSQ